jgi:hypothetical protein
MHRTGKAHQASELLGCETCDGLRRDTLDILAEIIRLTCNAEHSVARTKY